MSKTLNDVDREVMLRNAHHKISAKYRRVPLWAFVSDICGVGSTSGAEICRSLGWDQDADGSKHLPRHQERAKETRA